MSIFKKIFNRDDVVMSGELSLLREELAGVRDDLRSLEDASFLSRDWELFVSFVLSESRFSDRWDGFILRRKRFAFSEQKIYISIGALKEKVSVAGYDFSLLDLKRSSDVFDLWDALESGGGISRFGSDDALKKGLSD